MRERSHSSYLPRRRLPRHLEPETPLATACHELQHLFHPQDQAAHDSKRNDDVEPEGDRVKHAAERLPEDDCYLQEVADDQATEKPWVTQHVSREGRLRFRAAVEHIEPLAEGKQS